MPKKYTPERTDLASVARTALAAKKDNIAERLFKIRAKPPGKTAMRLTFAVNWNGYHQLTVYCAPQAESTEYTSHSNPYGPLLSFEPPPNQQDNPQGFATEKPTVGELVLRQLAEWWATTAGAEYPLPVVGTSEGTPTRLFDFATQQWRADETAVRGQQLTNEFAVLVRERLARFKLLAVERVHKATAKLGTGVWEFDVMVFFDDEFEVMFNVTDGTKHAHGRLFPPYSQLAKLLRNETFGEDRERYANLGVDTQHAYHRELEPFVADVWAEVAGPERVTRGRLEYHNDGAEYDLIARRWVTDFLGRPLV